jgi:hypothetical protein
MAINLKELQIALRGMTPQQKIYKVVKTELLQLGHWKNRKRGKPNPNFRRA